MARMGQLRKQAEAVNEEAYERLDNIEAAWLKKIITKEEELPDAIRDSIDNFVYDDKYREFNETFSKREDGQASKRFVDWVFRGEKG